MVDVPRPPVTTGTRVAVDAPTTLATGQSRLGTRVRCVYSYCRYWWTNRSPHRTRKAAHPPMRAKRHRLGKDGGRDGPPRPPTAARSLSESCNSA